MGEGGVESEILLWRSGRVVVRAWEDESTKTEMWRRVGDRGGGRDGRTERRRVRREVGERGRLMG